jgi:hypothetical protein
MIHIEYLTVHHDPNAGRENAGGEEAFRQIL